MVWQMSGGPAWATAAEHRTVAISAMANRGERICWDVMDFLVSFRIVSTYMRQDVQKRGAVNRGASGGGEKFAFAPPNTYRETTPRSSMVPFETVFKGAHQSLALGGR